METDPEVVSDISSDPAEGQTPPATAVPNPEILAMKEQLAQLAKANAEKDNYIAQMQERTLAAMERQAAPAAPAEDPFEGLDPQVRKYVEAQTAGLQKQLADTRNQLAGSIAAHDTLQVLDQHGIKDPAARSVATKLATQFKAAGMNFSAQDAVVFTLGQMALQNGGKLDLVQGDAGPRRGGPDVLKGGTRPMQMQTSTPALPENFDDLDPDQQISILEKRGVGKQSL